jgi:hypothetical protein
MVDKNIVTAAHSTPFSSETSWSKSSLIGWMGRCDDVLVDHPKGGSPLGTTYSIWKSPRMVLCLRLSPKWCNLSFATDTEGSWCLCLKISHPVSKTCRTVSLCTISRRIIWLSWNPKTDWGTYKVLIQLSQIIRRDIVHRDTVRHVFESKRQIASFRW